MRVVAGLHKGKRLNPVPSSLDTLRPTSDRAKEALFSILSSFEKGSFVDLFAGSGSVAIEAASRGYLNVHAVENHPESFRILLKNIEGTSVTAHLCDVQDYQFSHTNFDIIFCDPPYEKSELYWEKLHNSFLASLSPKGIIVFQSDKNIEIMARPDLSVFMTRTYGRNKFTFLKKT